MCENLSKIDINARNLVAFIADLFGHELDSSGEVTSILSECPRISISDVSMPQRKAISIYMSEWLEELLSSSKNIEILAESSLGVIEKGDEDLRMREMTSKERMSLKRYKQITKDIMFFRRNLTVSYLLPCFFFFSFSQNNFF